MNSTQDNIQCSDAAQVLKMSCRGKLIIERMVLFKFTISTCRCDCSFRTDKSYTYPVSADGSSKVNGFQQIQNGMWWRVERQSCDAKLSSRFPTCCLWDILMHVDKCNGSSKEGQQLWDKHSSWIFYIGVTWSVAWQLCKIAENEGGFRPFIHQRRIRDRLMLWWDLIHSSFLTGYFVDF